MGMFLTWSGKAIKEIKSRFHNNSIAIGNSRGTYGGGLVSSDESIRKNTISFVKEMCILSVKLGCPSTYLRPGSLNENGAYRGLESRRYSLSFRLSALSNPDGLYL